MEFRVKFGLVLIIAILLISGYFLFFKNDENNDDDLSDLLVDADGPYTSDAGKPIEFNGTARGGEEPYNWSWDFGDGNISYDEDPIYKYDYKGEYDVNLTVTDNNNVVVWDTTIVIIEEEDNNDDNGGDNDNGNDIIETHYVFVEESTAQDCKFCPSVGEKIHELFDSGKYNFYYVSMISDNEKANDRLENYYNFYANPTVYIDGGYEVILGNKSKPEYESKIESAMSRNVKNIGVIVTASLNNKSSMINITTTLKNHEKTDYIGNLKIYLTEIISTTWQDYNGNPYHYAFLDFALNRDITIPTENQLIITKDINASNMKLDPENLMIFAVVFSGDKNQGYSNPPNGNPFDAYYADAVNITDVVEKRNFPPEVGIIHPKRGKMHFFGKEIITFLTFDNTILFGKTTVVVQASDEESNISKVEFYLDDLLITEFTEPPYEWKWKNPSLFNFKHTFRAVAYDEGGKFSTATMDVFSFILT